MLIGETQTLMSSMLLMSPQEKSRKINRNSACQPSLADENASKERVSFSVRFHLTHVTT